MPSEESSVQKQLVRADLHFRNQDYSEAAVAARTVVDLYRQRGGDLGPDDDNLQTAYALLVRAG